jgi:arsenate reductase
MIKHSECCVLAEKKMLKVSEMKKVLFVCVENAGRSQMAEAFANKYGQGKLTAQSAGIKLAPTVNPLVVQAMKEKGIDISMNKPKLLTQEMANQADLIVTMGCGADEICPGPFFKETVDWALEDPKGKSIDKVREIRDEVEGRVKQLILFEKSKSHKKL